MDDDQTFRWVLIAGWLLVFPLMVYHRVKAATGERLDRWQEGPFILFTLRPVGLAAMVGLLAFLIDPSSMAWSSLPLPAWVRWAGVGLGVVGGALLVWTLRNLGPNLTDTVVTRTQHALVTTGPYRFVRHPFYDAVALIVVANALAAANGFLLVTFVLTLTLLVIRSRTEEQHLLARFGDAYRAYVERTGRFLPRLG